MTPEEELASGDPFVAANVKPVAEWAQARTVTPGGWFVAEGLNGDLLVVLLPPRTERGS